MHKLTNLEAQRVIAVLEDAVEQISLISQIPIKPDSELICQIDDVSLKDAIRHQWQIEERREVLARDPREDNDREVRCVALQVTEATRNLCRYLKRYDDPRKQRKSPLLACQQYLKGLTAIMFRRLSTTVEEEAANAHMMQELMTKEKNSSLEVIALRETLKLQRSEREQEVATLDRTLMKLRAELQDIMQENEKRMETICSHMELQIANSEGNHVITSEQLSQKIDSARTSIEAERQSNQDSEANLRKKKERLEADLTSQVVKYDESMGAIHRQTEDIKQNMILERASLLQLEDYFAKIDTDQNRRDVETAILANFNRNCHSAKAKLDYGATNIQKVVRGKQLLAFIRQTSAKKSKKGKAKKKK